MMMHMWLWFGCDIGQFMFSGLNIVTKSGLTATCVTLFVVGFFYEASKVVVAKTQRSVAKRLYILRQYDKRRALMWDSNGDTREAGPSQSISRVHTAMPTSRNYKICTVSYQTLLYTLHTTLGYTIMLAVMVYNAYLIIAVVLGMVSGYFVFGSMLMRIHMEYLAVTRPVCTDACDINAEGTTPPLVRGSLSSESELLACDTPSCSRGDSSAVHQTCNYGSKQCPAKMAVVANLKAKEDCNVTSEIKKEDARLLQDIPAEEQCSTPPALDPVVTVVSGLACCSQNAQKENTGLHNTSVDIHEKDTSILQQQSSEASCCNSTAKNEKSS